MEPAWSDVRVGDRIHVTTTQFGRVSGIVIEVRATHVITEGNWHWWFHLDTLTKIDRP
jgi:FKBP-type peptidyl-prolyl cis-trans isomerase 2